MINDGTRAIHEDLDRVFTYQTVHMYRVISQSRNEIEVCPRWSGLLSSGLSVADHHKSNDHIMKYTTPLDDLSTWQPLIDLHPSE